MSGGGILRINESIEMLFQIDGLLMSTGTIANGKKIDDDNSPGDSYWSLCRSIVTLERTHQNNDAIITKEIGLWKQILTIASEYVVSNQSPSKVIQQQLLRIYERATFRLRLICNMDNKDDNDGDDKRNNNKDIEDWKDDLYNIWFLYLQDLHRYGNMIETQQTIQYLQQNIYLEFHRRYAAFYIFQSKVQKELGTSTTVEEIIWQGIRNNAQPIQLLWEELKRIRLLSTINTDQPKADNVDMSTISGISNTSTSNSTSTTAPFSNSQNKRKVLSNSSSIDPNILDDPISLDHDRSKLSPKRLKVSKDGQYVRLQDTNSETNNSMISQSKSITRSNTTCMSQPRHDNVSYNPISTIKSSGTDEDDNNSNMSLSMSFEELEDEMGIPAGNNKKSSLSTETSGAHNSIQRVDMSTSPKCHTPQDAFPQIRLSSIGIQSQPANVTIHHNDTSLSETNQSIRERTMDSVGPSAAVNLSVDNIIQLPNLPKLKCAASNSLNKSMDAQSTSDSTPSAESALNSSVRSFGLPPLTGPAARSSAIDVGSIRKNTKPSFLQSSRLYQRLNQSNATKRNIPKLGMPQRVDPLGGHSLPSSDDEIESETDNRSVSTVQSLSAAQGGISDANSSVASNKGKITKYTKDDLSYIYQWDPSSRNKNKTKDEAEGENTKDDATRTYDDDTKSSNSNQQQQHSTPSNEKGADCVKGDVSSDESGAVLSKTGKKVVNTIHTSGNATQQDIPKQGIHPKFLPLVSEKNMIYVNGVAYAKLGVIGKGGSCKVYRALSSVDFSTVAIKKVKTAGMDTKAIAGYSNEIQLLQRLRGNPSIIQLFDSEVDIKSRKAIFLVMEPGEVDLNYVLQKHAVEMQESRMKNSALSKKGEVAVPNMNFIRLTWQQMLSAVHSMHEQRIIHGDLKPANFLFVRGTLKLIDFGIAKAIQNDDTTNIYRESQIGTINYMSPESILADTTSTGTKKLKCGRPSDIWSLGCILYQMVYGKTPFYDLPIYEKMRAIVDPSYYKVQYPNVTISSSNISTLTTVAPATAEAPASSCCAVVDAIQQCLQWKACDRPPIVGPGGLLNEHPFLNSL